MSSWQIILIVWIAASFVIGPIVGRWLKKIGEQYPPVEDER